MLRVEFGRLRPGQAGEQVPVLDGHELQDLALPIGDQLQRDRLHAAGAQPTPDLVPEQRADLVAHEAVEHAPRPLCGDHPHVDGPRMLQRILNRLLGDFVEREAVNLALLALQLLNEVPADRLALAIRVGGDVDVGRVLRRVLQLFNDLLARLDGFVRFGELVVDVDAQLALGQIADVSHRRDDRVVAPKVLADGFRLCRRLDHDE